MKKTELKKMKYLALAVAGLLMTIIAGCTKQKTDVTDLLMTVPSSSGGVVGINLGSMLEKAGCQINGSEIKPGKDLAQWLATQPEESKSGITALLDGDTGIDPLGAIIFSDAGRNILTFALSDPDRFRAYIEKKSNMTFTTESDVQVCGVVAVRGNQGWICLSEGRAIDPLAISAYAALNKSQSFLENKFSEDIATMTDDVIGWGQINTLTKNVMTFSQLSVFNMITGMLFDDASSLSFKLNFEKGEMESELVILNDNGKPAKYLLPTDKVDPAVLETLGTTCNLMAAFTVTPKLVEKLSKLGSAFGGRLFEDLSGYLKNVDGTAGFAIGNEMPNGDSSIEAVVTTKGEVSLDLKNFLSALVGTVKEDGKYLRMSNSAVSGSLEVKECASELKGAIMGAVLDVNYLSSMMKNKGTTPFKSFIFKVEPESGGVEFEFKLTGNNDKENILLTIIKNENQLESLSK